MVIKALYGEGSGCSTKFFRTLVGRFSFEYHFSGNSYMLRQPSACNLSFPTCIWKKTNPKRSAIFPNLGHFPFVLEASFHAFAFWQQVLQGQSDGSHCGFIIYEIIILCPRDHNWGCFTNHNYSYPVTYDMTWSSYSTASPLSLVRSTISQDILGNAFFLLNITSFSCQQQYQTKWTSRTKQN